MYIFQTSYATSFALYHLSQNPSIQMKVYEESVKILECKDSPMKLELFQNASYTRAVLKESLRLNPIAVGVGRILKKDTVLSGYQVPAGVSIIYILNLYILDKKVFMVNKIESGNIL